MSLTDGRLRTFLSRHCSSVTMERLVDLYPNSGALRLQLAQVYAGQGDKSRTYDTLLKMQNLGFAYPVGNDPAFSKVHGTKVWDYVVANLDANAKPFGEGKVAMQLPKGDTLLESLAWDPKRKQLLVGSAREGAIYRAWAIVGHFGDRTARAEMLLEAFDRQLLAFGQKRRLIE